MRDLGRGISRNAPSQINKSKIEWSEDMDIVIRQVKLGDLDGVQVGGFVFLRLRRQRGNLLSKGGFFPESFDR